MYGFLLSLNQICSSSDVGLTEQELLGDSQEIEEVFENQGRISMMSKKEYSGSQAYLHGRYPFSTIDGRFRECLELTDPPPLWQWEGLWKIDQKTGTDENGWTYSHSWTGDWHSHPSIWTKVRRRRWYRRKVPLNMEQEIRRQSLTLTSDMVRYDLNDAERIQTFLHTKNFTTERVCLFVAYIPFNYSCLDIRVCFCP